MFIDTNCDIININYDLISERAYESDIFKYPRYKAGDKDEDKGVYKGVKTIDYPVLLIEDNIINKEGFGIKKGFYKVAPNSTQDFLILYQNGDIKAKIPIVSVEQLNDNQTKKSSWWKRRKVKNRGILPEDYITSEAQIYYDKENDNYIIIWEFKNTKIKGAFKI